MEYIEGDSIRDYLAKYPEMIHEIFLQVISGFEYLEENNVLHRDIRPANIMVRDDGILKIIDFGFGKQIQEEADYEKSVSLNWWYEKPLEFSDKVYNFKTEVYFIGKMFEEIIKENGIEKFKYRDLLDNMCEPNPVNRIKNFSDINKHIENDLFYEIGFEGNEHRAYLDFANSIEKHITKIESRAEYINDEERVIMALDNAYRSFMLEEFVPNAALVTNCFLKGQYYFKKKNFPVSVVKNFLHFIKSSSPEKKGIILSNLITRIDSLSRYDGRYDIHKDDLPF
jgi:serine/threonine-protein kinase